MTSAIDPTQPVNGQPVSKSALRANLAAAKAEIERQQLAGNASVAVTDHGVIGDGITDNTQAYIVAQDAALAEGRRVLYWPSGHYVGNFVVDPRISWLGEFFETIIEAVGPGDWAIDMPPDQALDGALWIEEIWQRPVLSGIAVVGSQRTKNGIKVANIGGIDLLNVAVNGCLDGIHNSGNFHGTWFNLRLTNNDVGLRFDIAELPGFGHAGNKRIINPTIRVNRLGISIRGVVRRTGFYGGTIEGNSFGIYADDFKEGGRARFKAQPVRLEDIWFEDNANDVGDPPIIALDGTEIPDGDIYVNTGAIVAVNCGIGRIRIGPEGELYTYHSEIAAGGSPFMEVSDGGTFRQAYSLVGPLEFRKNEFNSLANDGNVGSTAERPDPIAVFHGAQWYDTDLGKPIWSNGTDWTDAMGSPV